MPEPHDLLLAEFLRAIRLSYTGEPRPSGHKKHRQVPLSQAEVAVRSDVSLTIVGLRERGLSRIPVDQLDKVAWAYYMSPEQRDELWLRRTGGYPPTGPSAPDPDAVLGWATYLHALQFPALAIDHTWKIEQSNRAWTELFQAAGQSAPANLLRFLLFSPYARALCGDWADGWVRPFLHDLRLEIERDADPALRRIASELVRVRDLAQIWEEASAPTPSALHGDGQLRLIRPPASERLHSVRMLVSSPAHDPRRRVILMIPTPENSMNLPSSPSNPAVGETDVLNPWVLLPPSPNAVTAA
jgi:hypothetical protein